MKAPGRTETARTDGTNACMMKVVKLGCEEGNNVTTMDSESEVEESEFQNDFEVKLAVQWKKF